MKSILRFTFLAGLLMNVQIAGAQLSGTYTIGGVSPDYLTFSDAVNAMVTQGLNGGVVFNVRAGTYSEQLTIPEIGGVNSKDSIIFQSETGVQSDVILRFAPSSAVDNWVVKLDGTDWITFKKMTIKSYGGFDFGTVLIIGNEAWHVNFQDCLINGKTGNLGNYTDKNMVDGMDGLVDSFITFNHCDFVDGKYAIRYRHAINLHIVGCTFTNTDNAAVDVYLNYNQGLLYAGNVETSGGPNIYYTYGTNDNIIANNYIAGKLDVSYSNGSLGHETIIVNNMILGYISLRSDRWVVLYNNTVYSQAGIPLVVSTYSNQGNSSNLKIANNIFVAGTDVALDLEDLIYLDYLDYNWYYSDGPDLLKLNGFGYADLDTWRISTSKSTNAISEPVHFLSNTDLHICRDQTLYTGDVLFPIPFDFDKDPRNALGSARGADEYDPWSLNPVSASTCSGQSLTINVTNSKSGDVFTWSGGDLSSPVNGTSLTVNPSSDQDYLLNWTGSVCSSTDTVHVTVLPQPNPSLIISNHTLSSSVAGISYEWYFNGALITGAGAQSYTVTQNGDYYVIVTDANGCTGQSNTVTISNVGIQNPIQNVYFSLAPNPNDGLFHLKADYAGQSNAAIEILNVLGQSIYQKTLIATGNGFDDWIDFSAFPAGLYQVALMLDHQRYVISMLKN